MLLSASGPVPVPVPVPAESRSVLCAVLVHGQRYDGWTGLLYDFAMEGKAGSSIAIARVPAACSTPESSESACT